MFKEATGTMLVLIKQSSLDSQFTILSTHFDGTGMPTAGDARKALSSFTSGCNDVESDLVRTSA